MFQVTVLDNPFIPEHIKAGITPKQAEFLCYEGREALYGGAAGGGKSVALLLAAFQYVKEPGYAALILRRTHKQLAKADSILAKAKEWLLPNPKVRWKGDDHKFTFPSGATLEFGHMEHEDSKHDYQGGAWAYVGVDEATQFTGDMLAYPRTRQRRTTGSKIPIRWRGASNPGGIGHDYVKARYVRTPEGKDPSTPDRQFFPATVDDNPHIDRKDYVQQLRESGVSELLLGQLLAGDWDAVAGGRFHREWFRTFLPPDGTRMQTWYTVGENNRIELNRCWRFATCDPAASSKETVKKGANPDYTVISTWAVTPAHQLLWLDCRRFRKEVPDIIPELLRVWDQYGPQFIVIEGGGTQKAVVQLARRTRAIVQEYIPPPGHDKLVRAMKGIVLVESGRLWLPAGAPWREVAESELVRFTGDEKQDSHDDIVDSLSMAAQVLGDKEQVTKGTFEPYVLGGGS